MIGGRATGLGEASVAFGTLAIRPAALCDRRVVGRLTALQRCLWVWHDL